MGKNKKEKKSKKKSKKHKDHKEKKKLKKRMKNNIEKVRTNVQDNAPPSSDGNFAIPIELMNSKHQCPETPEEYKKRQNIIRRVEDPVTGRTRLIKGDGEILEEIVSKHKHNEINKNATRRDGQYFEKNTTGNTNI
ncbi:ADP-ribosylation factor-like protein 6-interacting protein 4 [Teleopsis dalmanni]|uniref:ADP-ribosylation factor-like protein 6-interacting protein 4 n=1 Tax=Teleopsis dalmanni TaxID=139649 RepID=UPI0018CE8250|nr:ADP-ribosylation factor-like protein 6-interacting protein 4 [Teleopsis dalmanni]